MQHRTTTFAAVLMAAASLAGGTGVRAAQLPIPGDPVITAAGAVAGTALPTGVRAYLGIPYAEPPVGPLRWAPPKPIRWTGVWNADRKAPECIQILRAHDINHYFGEEATGEDCLYLNVWAPANAAGAKLPVIVFIYGGGGTVGSSGMAVYGGDSIAAQGAIFVSMNYRVGILGFMAHPELSREQGGHSGNYGYLDQTAALQWVHDNIAAFGGDPAKVLIAGQSFGAFSVAAQIFSPLSRGLYRAAAMWSACLFADNTLTGNEVPLAAAEAVGVDIQQRLQAAGLAALRNVPADKILRLQEEHQLGQNVRGVRLPPTVDGLFWTQDKKAALESHQIAHVPIMVGSNTDDIDAPRYPLTAATSRLELRTLAEQTYGSKAGEFLRLFPAASDADVPQAMHEAARENGFLRQSQTCAKLELEYNGMPTYVELFAHKHPYVPGVEIADQNTATIGAYHTADVPYWFGTLDTFNSLRTTRAWTARDRDLSHVMSHALIAFAATGDPATHDAPWPAWSPLHQQYVVFGDSVTLATMNARRMDWLAAHPPAAPPAATPSTRD